MDRQTTLWTLALCVILSIWLYLDVRAMHINYDWHSYLVVPNTSNKLEPRKILNLSKIINHNADYINQTNAIERLYDLQYNSNLENPITLDQSYSSERELKLSGWPVADSHKCGAHLDWILKQLAQHKDIQLLKGQVGCELMQFLDSFGRPESGFYAGTVTWLGSYKQCQNVRLNGGRIGMRYCQARMRPKWWPLNETVHPKSRIKIGICLPETCDTNAFMDPAHRSAIDTLIRFDLNDFFKQNLDFDSLFCLPDERSPIRQLPISAHVYLLLVSAWLALIVTASLLYEVYKYRERCRYESYEAAINDGQKRRHVSVVSIQFNRAGIDCSALPVAQDERKSEQLSMSNVSTKWTSAIKNEGRSMREFKMELLQALSVHNSLKEFKSDAFHEQNERTRSEQLRVRVDLGGLDFFKIWMAVGVVLAHSCYLTSVYTRSIGNRIEMNVNDNGRMVLSLGRCVDTFFMFFGVLTSYTILRKFTCRQLASPLIWAAINLGIMLRITPVFMLIYWYSRSISPYTGAGPWWDYGIYRYSMKGNCFNEPWWKSVPYFGCIGSPPVASCVLPAWFIVSYSQLSLIMPLLTYLMFKLPNHLARCSLILFATVISCAQLTIKMHKQTSFSEEAFNSYGSFFADLAEKFESTGTMATLGRVGCISVGCYIGYVLRMYEIGKIKKWPRWCTNKCLFATAILLHFVIIFMPIIGHRLSSGHTTSMNEFLSSYLISMFAWPVLNGIVIINGVTVYNRMAIVRFCSHPFWHTFNKLGFSIFLVHWEIIFIGVTGNEHSPSMGFVTDVMKMWSFGVFFSIILSFLIHILFEAPISTLLKLLARIAQERWLAALENEHNCNNNINSNSISKNSKSNNNDDEDVEKNKVNVHKDGLGKVAAGRGQ